MLFLGIITIQIFKVMAILGDRSWVESVYFNEYLIPIRSENERSPLNLSDLLDLAEILMVKNITYLFHGGGR